MTRGEVWLAHVGSKSRPVVILTRPEVIDVRSLVTVAEVTTTARGLTVEVAIGDDIGLKAPSVINCDGLHTISQSTLRTRVGTVDDDTMQRVCTAVKHAIGC